MEKYIVGGAVRDFLLARLNGKLRSQSDITDFWSHVEKDWVVVGATPEQMLKLGFRPVGKNFPVFLDPVHQEEYALARTERKTGHGYTAFECYSAPDVTLVDDLKRRDLTINAIAAPEHLLEVNFETIIDPYGGVEDLKMKRFRHVSPAFAEDPVRILRIARLATRFVDFMIDPNTLQLMQNMVAAGEVDALVPERVWQEWERSLREKSPWRFFEILDNCGAKDRLFPEISNLIVKNRMLAKAVQENAEIEIRFAIELYDLDSTVLEAFIKKYHIPNNYAEIAILVAKFHSELSSVFVNSEKLLDLFQKTDAFRRVERFQKFINACRYLQDDKNVELNLELVNKILTELLTINHSGILDKGFKGPEITRELNKLRLNKIEILLKKNNRL